MLDTPASLLERLCHRPEEQYWEQFVVLFTPLLSRWGNRLGVPATDTEDLLQEVFTTLFRKLPEFRYDPSKSFRAWLWTVFHRHTIAWRKRQTRNLPLSVKQLEALGGTANGYTDFDAFPVVGRPLMLMGFDLQPIDLGRVGQISQIALDSFELDLDHDRRIPVIPSLAVDIDDGGWLNVNADSVAAGMAGALEAESVLFLTDTPGVLKDRHDPLSRLPKLTVAECKELIATGVIDGGMIPKVEACFEALTAGAKRAVILDGRNPHSLLAEFLGEPGGTEVVP